jgi:hypothetical protein
MPASVTPRPFIIKPDPRFLEHYPGLKHTATLLAQQYAAKKLVSEKQLQAIGEQLWAALDMDDAFAAARQAAVQQLPWETLYHPQHRFLGKAPGFTLARRLPQVNVQLPELQPGPLRVLLFTVLPDDDQDADNSRLDVEEAQAQVQDALAPWVGQGLVQLEMPDDGRFAQKRPDDAPEKQPQHLYPPTASPSAVRINHSQFNNSSSRSNQSKPILWIFLPNTLQFP